MDEENDEIISEEELKAIIPSMNVNVPALPEKEDNLISDESLLGLYSEIIDNIRNERKEIDGLLDNFVNMVINEGDATSASKEALVNLVKIKSETADKMTKIADLMTRIKLKERDTFPRYLAAQQKNTIQISSSSSDRDLIKKIERAAKKKKDQNVIN